MESSDVIVFDRFELDLRHQCLKRAGRRVRIQPKPWLVLVTLASRPGETITRDELRAALWPADTHVEFDAGLNTAIRKVRRALGDAAAQPRYVQTLPGVGYRFMAATSRRSAGSRPPAASPPSASGRLVTFGRIAALLVLGVLLGATLPTLDPPVSAATKLVRHGESLMRLGDDAALAEAGRFFEAALAQDPELAHAWGWLALTHARRAWAGDEAADSQYGLARAAAGRALASDSRVWTAHAALAYVRAGLEHDRDGAFAAFADAVEEGAFDPRVLIDYACLLQRNGRSHLALRTIETGLRRVPRSAELRAYRGLFLHAVGRYDEELPALQEAVALDPTSADAHFHLGLGYARRRQYADALSALQSAVRISDGAPQMLSWLGRIAADAGRRREAEEVLDTLQRRAATSRVPAALIDAVAFHLAASPS